MDQKDKLKSIIKEIIMEELSNSNAQNASPKDIINAYSTWLQEMIDASSGTIDDTVVNTIISKSENFISILKRMNRK